MVDDVVACSGFIVQVVHDSASDDPLDFTDINDELVIYRGVLVKVFALVMVAAVCL